VLTDAVRTGVVLTDAVLPTPTIKSPIVIVALVVSLAILAALTVMQVLLIAGAPIGEYAWGGQHRVLPSRRRLAAVVRGLRRASAQPRRDPARRQLGSRRRWGLGALRLCRTQRLGQPRVEEPKRAKRPSADQHPARDLDRTGRRPWLNPSARSFLSRRRSLIRRVRAYRLGSKNGDRLCSLGSDPKKNRGGGARGVRGR
jgi:hypothetical protein